MTRTGVRRALVLGGTGVVGRAVLRALAVRGVPTAFTFFRSEERARTLTSEHAFQALQVDAGDAPALRDLCRSVAIDGAPPDVLIHCVGTLETAPALELGDAAWDRAVAVNARSAFVACAALAPRMNEGGDVVFVGGLDRAQSLPIPSSFAACQGMLGGITMSLAKELGPRGIRVNMTALGLLDAGLSMRLDSKVREEFIAFSALRRLGTPAEAAKSIVWLALENSYMSGKVMAVNGGI